MEKGETLKTSMYEDKDVCINKMKEGRKEGRREGGKERRKEGRTDVFVKKKTQ